jgi:hypothetical protein
MKTKLHKLPKAMLILCLVASASANGQSSFAGGARFDFEPNKWGAREFPKPNPGGYEDSTPHTVQNGSMPQGSNFLGVNPQMLSKPQQLVAPVVRARVMPQAQPVVKAIPLNNPFNPSFGQPVGLNAPIAALPKTAAPKLPEIAAVPHSLPNSSAEKAVSAKLMHANNNASKNVNGRLLHPRRAVGRSADALAMKNIDSYGKNFGYVPGAYLPTTVGSGTATRTAVAGKLLRH